MAKPEAELYRDKVELHLEGQQVFMLFFGGAILATLVFVLGVSIGRRIEKQSIERIASTVVSPLDALDKLEMGEELSFSTLLRNEPKKAVDDDSDNDVQDKEAKKKQVEEKNITKEPTPQKAVVEKIEKAPAEKRPTQNVVASKAKAKTIEKSIESEPTPKEQSRFTLQVGSFQNEKEAKNFESDLKKSGYKAFTKTIKLGDKGTWYRVRFGSYQDYDKALADKAAFEKEKNIIAYVTRVRK